MTVATILFHKNGYVQTCMSNLTLSVT